MQEYDPKIHNRQSFRLRGYDYSQDGAYFITICTKRKKCVLSEVIDGKIKLSQLGTLVESEWMMTAEIRPYVEINEFVIMPNHIHGIIVLDVGATRRVAPATTGRNHPLGPAPSSVGAIIGQFKSVTTKRINRFLGSKGIPFWQRNYYERIIRNDDEMYRIEGYIENNPIWWHIDRENIDRIGENEIYKLIWKRGKPKKNRNLDKFHQPAKHVGENRGGDTSGVGATRRVAPTKTDDL